jgi:hypothetical protein
MVLVQTELLALFCQKSNPEDAIIRDPIYLIRDDPELLVRLEAIITEHGWKRKAATSLDEMS